MPARLLFCLLIALQGCDTVPVTGRRQLSLVSEHELLSRGEQNFRQILAQSTVSRDLARTAQLNEVGMRVAKAAQEFMEEQGEQSRAGDYRWEFALIEDEGTQDSFALPGGKVITYTGMLKAADTPGRLAAVIAHDAAHSIANHAGERLSQLLLVNIGETTVSAAMQQSSMHMQQILLAAYGAGTQFGSLLPYDRQQELEADHIGLILMAKAGYDPCEAVALWDNLERLAKERTVVFLATHVPPEDRTAELRRHLPEALACYRSGAKRLP
jgi:predicted Zn-dependent protease